MRSLSFASTCSVTPRVTSVHKTTDTSFPLSNQLIRIIYTGHHVDEHAAHVGSRASPRRLGGDCRLEPGGDGGLLPWRLRNSEPDESGQLLNGGRGMMMTFRDCLHLTDPASQTRVICIKTQHLDNVHIAMQRGTWITGDKVGQKINEVYKEHNPEAGEKVLFIFSINRQRSFCALAQMNGPWVKAENTLPGWQEAAGNFNVVG